MADRFESLGDIRAAVLTRTGFGGQGSAAGPIINVVDEYINDGYDVLFDLYDVRGRNQDFFFTTNQSQEWYDIPSGLDVDKIDSMAVKFSNIYIPMTEFITIDHESVAEIQNYPQRYDVRYNSSTAKTQIKVWPQPNASYTVKIRGYIDKAELIQDADIAYVDATMLKKYATAHTKKHLNRPDADAAMQSLNARIRQVKANQHGRKRYIRGKKYTRPLPKPVVVE